MKLISLQFVSVIALATATQGCAFTASDVSTADTRMAETAVTGAALAKVDTAMTMLGINKTMMTNPSIIDSLLSEMKLSDFKPSSLPMQEFLRLAKSTPQPMAPLLQAIREGVAHHPAIMEFIELAINNKWLEPFKELEITLNQIYLLESLTAAMANNYRFVVDIQEHILDKRSAYGIKPHSTFSTFLAYSSPLTVF